jgi:hypothetical protein
MRPRFALKSMLGIALVCLTGSAMTATAQAAVEPWGEISHFADKSGELSQKTQPAFGISPEDGSAWVGDVIQNSENNPVLRLQKFVHEGGSWKVAASEEFTIGFRTLSNGEEPALELKGVAFDPALHRAYMLVEEERATTKPEVNAAAQLWEFSTNTSKLEGKVLVDRTEGAYSGPVGESKFDPQGTSTKTGRLALNEPSGMTVDPVNHDILITGWVGPEGNKVASMWAISKEGKIESDWEDKEGKEQFFEDNELNSPVVTSAGKILVLGEAPSSTIYEMPALGSKESPKVAFALPETGVCQEKLNNHEPACAYIEKLTSFSVSGKTLTDGGRLSIGANGDIYVHSRTANAALGGNEEGSVMIFTPSFEEIGWTGGGSWFGGARTCAIDDSSGGGVPTMIAVGPESAVAGAAENVFMYERGASPRQEGVVRIMQLGPKGSTAGCPMPLAEIKATANGTNIEGISVPIADKVVFETKLTQANEISTEWEPEPGVKVSATKREQQSTRFEYKFKKPGTYAVKEQIRTDDLAMPVQPEEIQVKIAGPVVQSEQALVEGSTAATLKAEVNPGGQATTCEFQYEEVGVSGAKTKPCPTAPGEDENFHKESVKVEGLKPGKEYCFKLVAKSGEYTTEQACTKFSTPAVGAPEVHTEAATAVTSTTATLNGKVNPEESSTTCFFKYGLTNKYESGTVPCATNPGGGNAPVAVIGNLEKLIGSTTYHFVLVAENGKGKTEGTDQSFTTPAAAAKSSVATLKAGLVTKTSAIIKGTVNPEGAAVESCVFQYGTTTTYGSTAACPTAAGSGRGAIEESFTLGSLSPGTTYHYRIVAKNSLGESFGADESFTTAAESGGGGGGGNVVNTNPGEIKPPGNGVLNNKSVAPDVTVAGLALAVAGNGSFSLKLSCPAGATACNGTVTVKTLTAVAASAHAAKAKKKAILTLASGSFAIVGGKLKLLTLHLSSKAKALLAKVHTLRARVTIVAHDTSGQEHTTTAVVSLKAPKKKKH